MKEKFKLYGSILILVIFVPYLATVYLQGGSFFFSSQNSERAQEEARVVQLVAEEMPVDYEPECLKAQAVIARTNLRRQQQEETAGQEAAGQESAGQGQPAAQETAGWTQEQMREAWGERYEQNLERIREAVSRTEGEVITYRGELIDAAYHAASNKKTRNASEVPGQEEAAYLVSADSEADILAEHFLYIGYMEKQPFAEAVQSVFEGETVAADQLPAALQIVERDSADYVTKVKYGKTTVNGEALRRALHLNSACFYFSELEGQVRIVTKGLGHGLGLSQYGANELAKKGYDYREILAHYYRGITVGQSKN